MEVDRAHAPLKLIPLLVGTAISLRMPAPVLVRVAVGVAAYLALYFITWRRSDGTRAFPPWLW